jgi:hypothetical protein
LRHPDCCDEPGVFVALDGYDHRVDSRELRRSLEDPRDDDLELDRGRQFAAAVPAFRAFERPPKLAGKLLDSGGQLADDGRRVSLGVPFGGAPGEHPDGDGENSACGDGAEDDQHGHRCYHAAARQTGL